MQWLNPMNNKPPIDREPVNGLPSDDPRRLATAFHEAGHAVMAQIVGRPIEKVSIAPAHLQNGGMRLGLCKIQKGRSRASRDSLEDEVMVLFAGMVAESHLTDRYCQSGAGQDLRTIRRLLSNRAGNERQREKLERRLLEKTEHVLSDKCHCKAIELVANEFVLHETISGRAVRHLLSQALK